MNDYLKRLRSVNPFSEDVARWEGDIADIVTVRRIKEGPLRDQHGLFATSRMECLKSGTLLMHYTGHLRLVDEDAHQEGDKTYQFDLEMSGESGFAVCIDAMRYGNECTDMDSAGYSISFVCISSYSTSFLPQLGLSTISAASHANPTCASPSTATAPRWRGAAWA
jgi:hypothetical protein